MVPGQILRSRSPYANVSNQFKNTAAADHHMYEIIGACESGHDHDCDPMQVKCRFIPHTLDDGSYSRLREINEEGGFSVVG